MTRLIIFVILLFPKLLFSLEVILLFGPPGSGKGTFAQYAKEKGYGHISAGDLVRDEINRQTKIGLEIEELVKRGEYIDPAVMFQLVKDRAQEYVCKDRAFIIDGYGRTVSDAARVREFLHEIKAEVRVVFLEASDASCKERVLNRVVCPQCCAIFNQKMGFQPDSLCPHCHEGYLQIRLNDTPEVIEKRLKLYREQIHPCYSSFLVDLPSVVVNTDCDLESCFSFYDSLL